MDRLSARKPLTSLIVRVSGGRRLRLTLRKRPRISRALLALLGSALGWPAYALDGAALPQGGQVAAGQASIAQSGANLSIRQGSDRAVLNWQSFNVGSQARVEFVQPNSQSVALNRVTGNQASQIHGQIKANGQVFLSNPNGVVFAPGSQVNVGGLVATTLNIGDQDFMQGRYTLSGASQAEIRNAGRLHADASLALIAATVRNDGELQAGGDVALASGQQVSLDLHGDGLLSLRVDASALRGQVDNGGAVQAGNQVLLTAAAADDLIGSVVNNSGILRASGLSVEGGKISLSGGLVSQSGTLDASGNTGGQVRIAAHTLMDAGQTLAEGSGGGGGAIRVDAEQITQTRGARMSVDGTAGGGDIQLQGGSGEYGKVYSSARLSAQGNGDNAEGGRITLTADSTQLRAAELDASGQAGGGSIEVGGGWQGQDAGVANARETGVNASTTLSADARHKGDGGSVVVWSEQQTTFAGHIAARGGERGGNGGQLEVSGKDDLTFAGSVDTASPFGLGGSLLLDPKNLIISDAAALFAVLNLDDPNPADGNEFGQHAVEVGSGNIAVTAAKADIGGVRNTGAAYLFDGESGALISSLFGSAQDDYVGTGGLSVLANGDYLVSSYLWGDRRGAVTYGRGDLGVAGQVDASNSLVGSNAGWQGDQVGREGITQLGDGGYLVLSENWSNARGSLSYGRAGEALSGEVGVANSLIGSTDGDRIGFGSLGSSIELLDGGAYVVRSRDWDNGAAVDVGALTYGAAGAGVKGEIGIDNSLIGTPQDRLGLQSIMDLGAGAYLVLSPSWSGGQGAVTYGASGVGARGLIDSGNSLVGGGAFSDVIALGDGAYVVRSSSWNSNRGSVTYGAAGVGVSGAISAANSLVGSRENDYVGRGSSNVNGVIDPGITLLGDGAYVVNSSEWQHGTEGRGAVTYGAAGQGVKGEIGAGNSLLVAEVNGSGQFQKVTALGDGAYVVNTPGFYDLNVQLNDNQHLAGAVTYGHAGAGVSGYVSESSSLLGTNTRRRNGGLDTDGGTVTALGDGAYTLQTQYWDHGVIEDAGAVTYGAAGVGVTGRISASNSLVGVQPDEFIGRGSVVALGDGAYVVSDSSWSSGRGHVTYGAAGVGALGAVGASNIGSNMSLVGEAGDYVGLSGITVLGNGAYAVRSYKWGGDRGAVTYGSAGLGVSGLVDAGNSLVGGTLGDFVGQDALVVLSDGSYLVPSRNWDNGAFVDAGALSYGAAGSGAKGVIGADNSLVGSTANQRLDAWGVTDLGDGAYLRVDSGWNESRGAVTYGASGVGAVGAVGAANSLVGSAAGDRVGSGGVSLLKDGGYVVSSPDWDAGAAASSLGAVTFAAAGVGAVGEVSAANSLVGSTANDRVGEGGITLLSDGGYMVSSPNWDNGELAGAGAVTYGAAGVGVSGVVASGNSLVGAGAGDFVGLVDVNLHASSSGVAALADGRVLVRSPYQTVDGQQTGRVNLISFGGLGGDMAFADNASSDFAIAPARIAEILSGGTALTLQASNDITLASALAVDNPAGNGGHLTLQAGRSIHFNANLSTDNGDLTAIAGDPGALAEQREAGQPSISIADGVSLAVGTGTATLAAIDGNFINNAGADAILTAGAGRYLIYSSAPDASIEGLSGYAKHYSQSYTPGSVPSYAGSGNWMLYSITPVLSVSPNASVQTYGELSLAGLGYGLSGFIDGDLASSAGLSGSANFTAAGSAAGSHDLTYAGGLASALGYALVDATASTAELTVTPRAINLSAAAASKVYGEADPGFSVSVVGGSLAAGDSLSEVTGSLGRQDGENVGVYDVVLGSGLKAGNYRIDFDADNQAFSITPRELGLSVAALDKVYGEADPSLGMHIATGSLAAGDSLAEVTGSLSRQAGENVGVYDIVLGSGLKAGNYRISFDADNNALTISPRALLVAANDAERGQGEANPDFSASFSGWAFDDALEDLQGELVFSTEATPESAVGEYAISPAGLSAGNYILSFVNGVMRVLSESPAPQPTPTPVAAGALAEQAEAQVDALLAGQFALEEGDGQAESGDGAGSPAELTERLQQAQQLGSGLQATGGSAALSTLGGLLSSNAGIRLPAPLRADEL